MTSEQAREKARSFLDQLNLWRQNVQGGYPVAESASDMIATALLEAYAQGKQDAGQVEKIYEEALKDTVARADDYADSWISRPARDAIEAARKLRGGG